LRGDDPDSTSGREQGTIEQSTPQPFAFSLFPNSSSIGNEVAVAFSVVLLPFKR
jgi:hypothetical protein